jgi:hypothetical protein
MTSITDINYEDIEEFLYINNVKIPLKSDDAYDIAWDLIQREKDVIHTNTIISWMKAYNLSNVGITIKNYSEKELLTLSDDELDKLKLLTDENDINNIIDILRFMHKVKEFDITKLHENMIYEVIKNMDIDEIENMCLTSRENNKLCQKKEFKNVIISKLPLDSLNVNDFTLKQLFFYDKVLPLKNKLLYTPNNIILVNINEKIIKITARNIKSVEIKDSNQIIRDDLSLENLYVLDNNGQIYLYNSITKEKKYDIININEKVVNINSLSGNINVLTISGKYYIYNQDRKTITNVIDKLNIIQKFGVLVLTLEGKVYYLTKLDIKENKVITTEIQNLPKIVQMTNLGYTLAANGEVYKNSNVNTVIKLPVNNIIQIVSTANMQPGGVILYVLGCLDINGDVFIIKNEKEKIKVTELSDIIEISFAKTNLIALDKNYKLYQYDVVNNVMGQNYDLKKL